MVLLLITVQFLKSRRMIERLFGQTTHPLYGLGRGRLVYDITVDGDHENPVHGYTIYY